MTTSNQKKTVEVRRFFPNSQAFIVHQTGAQLTRATKGVEIILHTREGETAPYSAELVCGMLYADIGLTFEGKELCDYDGVFALPREVGVMLTEAGFTVPENCF